MRPYDSRRITLDPGLTALALRGLQSRRGNYPFIEPHTRGRRVGAALRKVAATWFPTVHALLTTHSRVA